MMTSMTSAISKESKPVNNASNNYNIFSLLRSSVEEGVDLMTQTMFFVGRLFLTLLCVRMQMAARLEKRSRATVEAALRQKCPGNVMFIYAAV